jgi:hydrogenase maturation protease
MNTRLVEKIADAVLYEGYLLYPYRSSAVKNRQRFNFGVLYPRQYCDLQPGSDSWEMRTECLVTGSVSTMIEVKVRFLQLVMRQERDTVPAGGSLGAETCAAAIEESRLKSGCSQDWLPHKRQEGRERDVSTPACTLESIVASPYRRGFVFTGADDAETLQGELELGALHLNESLYRLSLSVRNIARLEDAKGLSRDQVLLRSLVSVHSILHVVDGEFVSLLDPPEEFKAAAGGCQNAGAWPVLAGDEGQRNLVLSAPIILYDYPQIAPESAGDLFDGCEIDEILALRILTMTDAEKLEVRNGDDRARQILERTELLPPEHFQKIHGALRGLRVSPGGTR